MSNKVGGSTWCQVRRKCVIPHRAPAASESHKSPLAAATPRARPSHSSNTPEILFAGFVDCTSSSLSKNHQSWMVCQYESAALLNTSSLTKRPASFKMRERSLFTSGHSCSWRPVFYLYPNAAVATLNKQKKEKSRMYTLSDHANVSDLINIESCSFIENSLRTMNYWHCSDDLSGALNAPCHFACAVPGSWMKAWDWMAAVCVGVFTWAVFDIICVSGSVLEMLEIPLHCLHFFPLSDTFQYFRS